MQAPRLGAKAQKALGIKSMVWREMSDFSADCILAVFASEFYDESDYIRDYSEFLAQADRSFWRKPRRDLWTLNF
jgi:hypothetical protein